MARPLWFVKLLKKHFNLRFFGAEMTKWPVIGHLMERALFNGHRTGDALFYLPKDRVVINAKVQNDESSVVAPSKVVEHFIKQARYIFLMNECICREAADCQDFDHKLGCIFLGEAVLDINPELGQLVDQEKALVHVERARQAGLVHLIGRDKIDAVWMGVKPSTKLMTICNCCPCCCLFKFLPNLAPKLQKKIERMPGVHVEVTDDCVGCGACTENVCFIDAISLENGRAVIREDCRGCGNCAEVCPESAIRVVIERDDYIQNAIDRLSRAVDVE
jgi:ferredoxin